jgi:hypothetical protein
MNERIKQLAQQAGYKDFDYAIIAHRFAELIVKECLKELRYTVVDTQECRQDKSTDYQVGWEDGMFDAGETIKEHFGVEE